MKKCIFGLLVMTITIFVVSCTQGTGSDTNIDINTGTDTNKPTIPELPSSIDISGLTHYSKTISEDFISVEILDNEGVAGDMNLCYNFYFSTNKLIEHNYVEGSGFYLHSDGVNFDKVSTVDDEVVSNIVIEYTLVEETEVTEDIDYSNHTFGATEDIDCSGYTLYRLTMSKCLRQAFDFEQNRLNDEWETFEYGYGPDLYFIKENGTTLDYKRVYANVDGTYSVEENDFIGTLTKQ